MNKNNYTLDDFLEEYDWENSKIKETCIGLEFDYKDNHYRISREIADNSRFYLIKVTFLNRENSYGNPNYEYKILGIYDNIQDLLKSKEIDRKELTEVLFSEGAEITDQD